MTIIGRFLGALFSTFCFFFIIGTIAFIYSGFLRDIADYDQLRNYEPPVVTRVYASDGVLLSEYFKERRFYLPKEMIPTRLKEAFIAAEDKNFYKHFGIAPLGIARAFLANLTRSAGAKQQGASTITQQVAKNFFLSPAQTYARKIREIILALRLERIFSKEKILELYLNQIYLGVGTYGVAAATLTYYGKSVHELTLNEVAYLAALPKAPANYDPQRRRAAAVARRDYVLSRMREDGYISAQEAAEAQRKPLGVELRKLSPDKYAADYFAEEVRRELVDRYSAKKVLEGGLSVHSTLDVRLQLAARKILNAHLVKYDEKHGWRGPVKRMPNVLTHWAEALAKEKAYTDIPGWKLAIILDVTRGLARIGLRNLKKYGDAPQTLGVIKAEGVAWTKKRLSSLLRPGDVVYVEKIAEPSTYRLRQFPEISGSLIAIEASTGRIRAMVGGFSHDASEVNRATQALRQPGSGFKPFVYAAALDNGYTPTTIIEDEPIEIDLGYGLGTWRPVNYGGKSGGKHTLRYGLEHSKNLMTVRLARAVGMPLVTDYAKRFGVYDDLPPVISMSLGAVETTVLRMTAAYAVFANGGKKIRPGMIDYIRDRWGNTLYKRDQRTCEGCEAFWRTDLQEPIVYGNTLQLIPPMTAYQVTFLMEGVIQRGTARSLRALKRTLAGKTGTTNLSKDLWFIGYSSDLVVGVYLGYDNPRTLGNSATASRYAVPVFGDFMKVALEGKEDKGFKVPEGIKFIRVNPKTGFRSNGKGSILEAFKPGTSPAGRTNDSFSPSFPDDQETQEIPQSLERSGTGIY